MSSAVVRLVVVIGLAWPAAAGCARAARSDSFDVKHELTISVPEGAREVRIWFAMPQADPAQSITGFRVEAPWAHRIVRDSEGNDVLYVEAREPKEREIVVRETFRLTRSEVRPAAKPGSSRFPTETEQRELARYLEPDEHVVVDDRIRALSKEIVGDARDPIEAARRIYDWVLENVDYWVKDPAAKKASAVGSTTYCLETRTGNCTDFHSLFASLSRAAGVPTRIVYGSLMKPDLDGGDADLSYHCWIEFDAPGVGWVPLDVAVADIYAGDFDTDEKNETLVRRTTADGYRGPQPEKVEFYFGGLDSRRVTLSSGRDISLPPDPAAGPVNALPKAHVVADGRPLAENAGWKRKLTYRTAAKN